MSADAAAVIGRARRSFAFSIGLLVIGFIAVAAALVYRSGESNAPGGEYSAGVLALPDGAEVISIVPSDGMFAAAYRLGGKTRLRLINGETGAILRDVDVVSE